MCIRDRQGGDIVALEQNASAGRAEEFREQIETGGLAGAIRPDQSVDAPALDAQADAVDGGKAGKLLSEILGFEDRLVIHHATAPRLLFSASFHGAARATKGLVFHINCRLKKAATAPVRPAAAPCGLANRNAGSRDAFCAVRGALFEQTSGVAGGGLFPHGRRQPSPPSMTPWCPPCG